MNHKPATKATAKSDSDLKLKLRRARHRIRNLNRKLKAAKTQPANATGPTLVKKKSADVVSIQRKSPTLTGRIFDAVVDYMREEVSGELARGSRAA